MSFIKSWFWIIVWPHFRVVCNVSFDFCGDFQGTFTDWILYLHFWTNQWRIEQGLFMVTHLTRNSDRQKKTLTPPPKKKKWMNLISNWLSTASINYLNWPSPVFGRFQNGCNKEVIEPRVVQFWSEIMLVISNRTRAARLFDFEITRMISAQIALCSDQLPL